MTSEIWRQIPGALLGYEVSDQGNVRSPRKQLKACDNGSGYLMVTVLWIDPTRQKTCTVHSLVALTFNGPCPDGLEISHRDHVKTNNVPDNLDYVTRAANMNAGHPRTAACWLPWESTPVGGSFLSSTNITQARRFAANASSRFQKAYQVKTVSPSKTLVTRTPMLGGMTCSASAEIGGAA